MEDIRKNGAVAVGEGRNVIILNRREFGRASGYQVSDETIDHVAINIFLPNDAPWAEGIRWKNNNKSGYFKVTHQVPPIDSH